MIDDLKDIKQNTNGFSFTDTVASLVNNREYRSGYNLLKNGEHNDKTYFWECLSAVGEEIGDVIYENVLNYINNVANINTCKIHALKSIATVLGIKNFAVLGNIEQVPLDVLNLINVFSINRAYLLNVNNFDSNFVRDFFDSTLDHSSYDRSKVILSTVAHTVSVENNESQPSSVFGLSGFVDDYNLSNIFIVGNLSAAAYENYIEECFFKLLTSKIFQQYGDEAKMSGDLIFLNLSANDDFDVDDSLEYTRHSEENETNVPYSKNILWYTNENNDGNHRSSLYKTNYANYIYRLKKSLNVPLWFNQRLIVDKIENGFDYIDNYSGGELSVLKAEIAERSKPKYSNGIYATNRPTTRYSYYNEVEVKKYIKFIDGIFSLSAYFNQKNANEPYNPYNLANIFNPYGLDITFSDITNMSVDYGLLSNINECYDRWLVDNRVPHSNNDLSNFLCNYYVNYTYSTSKYINSIKVVARILKDICLSIVDIRERLKTQSQRNYMVGTKLLIEYILNEYLINALVRNYGIDPDIAMSSFGVLMIEYNDTTEYFNIGRQVDDVNLIDTINKPYWNQLSINPFNGQIGGVGLPEEDIKNFYLSTLNIKNTSWRNCISSDTYYDFLSAVYDLGRSESYYSIDKGLIITNKERFLEGVNLKLDDEILYNIYGLSRPEISALQRDFIVSSDEGYLNINYSILSDYQALSDNLSNVEKTITTYNERLSVCYAQQEEIILKYHGADIFYYPWYNYKNQVYPTFQTHPYMYNFIEHNSATYPVENAFYGNANEDLIMELQSKNISVYLEEYGNIVRVWRNSNFDYSGYKSRYEASTHNVNVFSNPSQLYSVTHYDGTFYPPALKLYKQYLNEELERVEQTSEDVFEHGYKLVGWERLSVDMLCSSYDTTNVENLTVNNISNMWHYYSHLDLPFSDRNRIYNQLVNLSAYLSDVSIDDRYDIYRYGLDMNMNSYVLYKQHNSSKYIDRRDDLGQLWIRFNNHPIGFPAFVIDTELSDYGQFNWNDSYNNKSLNDSLCSYVFSSSDEAFNDNGLKSPNVFYDFDLASSGRYLLLAANNRNRPNDYKHAIVFAGKISEHRTIDYKHPESEHTIFNLITYGNECLYPSNEIEFNNFDKTNYEFVGFYQNNYTVYAGYIRRYTDGNILSAVGLNAIEYPAEMIQSNNVESYNFTFDETWKQILLNSSDISSLNTKADANIVLGYSDFDEMFSLVVQQEMLEDNDIVVQDFTGRQTTEHIDGYGKTNVVFGTKDDGENKTSFDRFSDYITIYDIDREKIVKRVGNVNPLIYGLNADASWIPLYPGLSGQNLQYRMLEDGKRISYNKNWHELSVAKESIELLGHSYQDLANKYDEFESTIIEDDETGKMTNYDPNSALDAVLRVYEDFSESALVFNAYSSAIRFDTSSDNQISSKVPANENNSRTIEFIIGEPLENDLSSYTTINSLNNSSNKYRILLLNVVNGKTANPILAGKFCKSIVDNPQYNGESTYNEDYMLSTNGCILDKQMCVVGTQNPFDFSNLAYEVNYSNHLFNISSITSELKHENGKFKIVLTLRPKYDFSFVIPTGQFRLFIYKSSLEEFSEYHYMEPFGHFPYNAAVSSWSKVPWKDTRYPFLYHGGIVSSDKWWSKTNYRDMRDRQTYHLNALSANGANDYNLVGNMLLSSETDFYDVSTVPSQISLMERIELSSIESFDEQYFLSTGQITFKISEDSRFNSLRSKYPPASIDQLLWSMFKDTNKSYNSTTVFDLSNTYVFQLEDPDRIAELIGKIGIPIYEDDEQNVFVYENFITDYVRIDINGNESISNFEIFDIPTNADYYVPTNEYVPVDSHTFNVDYEIDDNKSLEENLNALSSNGGYPHGSEKRGRNSSPYDYVLTSVTGKDISDYLKVYVNWRYFTDKNGKSEVELFFNAQNLFNSPYHYRTKSGFYAIEFKPNTYLRLKSGENDYLHIILQFKYFDMNKNLIGIRDLPILTYHIYNISDDKPKFLLVKTYEINNDNEKMAYISDNNNVYIIIENKTYGYDVLEPYINWDYTLLNDFFVNVNMEIIAPIPLKELSVEFVYERGQLKNPEQGEEEPEFILETDKSYTKPGSFEDKYGLVYADIGNNMDVNLAFTLVEGAYINEEFKERFFPIELVNASGIDINGNSPNFIFINGGVKFDVHTNGIKPGLYLGRETNIVKLT